MIDRLRAEGFAAATLCEVLEVPRSGYYAWRAGATSRRAEADEALEEQVRAVFWDHERRFGSRRIASELADLGTRCGVARVSRLMRRLGLKAIQPRSYQPRTTDSRHRLGYSPNLLLERPFPTAINQVWVGDISYVPLCGGGFLYLAMLLDLYSRQIVGWALADHMREALVLGALRRAIAARQPPPGLVHHSDRGGQYAGEEYRRVLARAGMRPSMSRAETSSDNAFMESCFGTLKRELEMKCYDHEAIARREIGTFVRYYNTRRRHSALGNQTPDAFEAAGLSPQPRRRKGKTS